MKAHASELQRYETLLNHARRALVQVAALERQGLKFDRLTREALIRSLEEGLAQLDARATPGTQADRLARRRHALAQLSAQAQETFSSLGVTEPPLGVDRTHPQGQG
jgi:hypothetical protein